jgi:tetratricopeptide (TPR) repeat protein
LLLVVTVLLLLGGVGGWWWFWGGPTPPAVPSEGVDGTVVEQLEKARLKVLWHPHDADAWGSLGKLFLVHGYPRQAHLCWGRAEELNPADSRWPYFRGVDAVLRDPPNALPYLRRAVAVGHSDPLYRTAARLRLAEVLLEAQQWDEAEQIFRDEYPADSTHARTTFGLGLIALFRGELEASAGLFQPLVNSPFARRKAAAQLALISRRLGQEQTAISYQNMVSQPPDDLPWPDPYVGEYARLEAGRLSRFTKATELEEQGRLPEAISLYREVVRDFPDERSYVALGIALAKAGDYPAAEEVLRTTLQLAPEHVTARYFLGLAVFFQAERQWNSGDAERARARSRFREVEEQLRRTTALKPDHALAHFYRGQALRYLDDRPGATAAFRQAVLCRPEYIDGHLALAEVLTEAGQKEEALGVLREAEKMAGAMDPRPKQALEKLAEKKPPGP